MKRKQALGIIWLLVLGGLLYGVIHFGNEAGNEPRPITPASPALDAGRLSSRWQDILQNAAAPPKGASQARYSLVEFGDFQCPQCGTIRPLLEALLSRYPDRTQLFFVHRPFPFYSNGTVMHKWAVPSAQAAQAAATMGKFWPMYDILYEHQDDLEPGFYGDYAVRIGLSKPQFLSLYRSGAIKSKVEASMKFTEKLGIISTPTVVVRDNHSGQIWVYVGRTGQPGQPGVENLAAHPPWAK